MARPAKQHSAWEQYDGKNRCNQTGNRSEEKRRLCMKQRELGWHGCWSLLYYYNDVYLQKTDVEGIYANLFGSFKYFDLQPHLPIRCALLDCI